MLCLPYECHARLRSEAERAYPDEACGILLGRRDELDDEVACVVPCTNAAADPSRRFAIAPEELIAAQRRARAEDLQLLGFYHSHPDHPADPSESDRGEAFWDGCTYLICSVEKGELAAVQAERLRGAGEWEPVRVHFAPPEGGEL